MYNTINLNKVNLDFEEKKILKNISFEVQPKFPKCIVEKVNPEKAQYLNQLLV